MAKKKKKIGPDFCPFWLPKFFSWISPRKLSFYAISRKPDEPNLRKWQNTRFQA